MPYSIPHISLSDTTTQSISVANTPQVVTFNTTDVAHKIVATTSSRFTFNEAGEYDCNFSYTVTAGAANKTLDIWIRVNGTDVNNSNVKVTVVNNELKHKSAHVHLSVTAGQYVELWMSGDDTSLQLITYAVGTSPTRPVTPSVRMDIKKLHN